MPMIRAAGNAVDSKTLLYAVQHGATAVYSAAYSKKLNKSKNLYSFIIF